MLSYYKNPHSVRKEVELGFKTEIGIDLENPPPVIKIEYGNPVSVTDHLCPEHMRQFFKKDEKNGSYIFRYQPVTIIKEAGVGKTCRICSYTRGIPK